jgi:hypothetical protein
VVRRPRARWQCGDLEKEASAGVAATEELGAATSTQGPARAGRGRDPSAQTRHEGSSTSGPSRQEGAMGGCGGEVLAALVGGGRWGRIRSVARGAEPPTTE